jgi:hypothetical protein
MDWIAILRIVAEIIAAILAGAGGGTLAARRTIKRK